MLDASAESCLPSLEPMSSREASTSRASRRAVTMRKCSRAYTERSDSGSPAGWEEAHETGRHAPGVEARPAGDTGPGRSVERCAVLALAPSPGDETDAKGSP